MKTCIVCGKLTEKYVKIKKCKILCKSCMEKLPDVIKKQINMVPDYIIQNLLTNYIYTSVEVDFDQIKFLGSLILDQGNGRLSISNSWIRTGGIKSFYFRFYPTCETKSTITGRLAIVIELQSNRIRIQDEVDTFTIKKDFFVAKAFPWNHFAFLLEKNQKVYAKIFWADYKTQKKKDTEKESSLSVSNLYQEALDFYGLTDDYTEEQLKSLRRKMQKKVHPDNNENNESLERLEELSKQANQYFDILNKRFKKTG